MDPQKKTTPQELEAALQDLRRIREVVDSGRDNHPIRLIWHDLLIFSALLGVLFMVFGVLAQLILLYSSTEILGLSSTGQVWALGILLFVVGTVLKLYVYHLASKRAGYDMSYVMKTLATGDYMRLMGSVMSMAVVTGVALAISGQSHMLVGLIVMALGFICLVVPTIFPLRLTTIGFCYVILGILAMFLLPQWPFYKFAAILGLPMFIGALVGRSRPRPMSAKTGGQK